MSVRCGVGKRGEKVLCQTQRDGQSTHTHNPLPPKPLPPPETYWCPWSPCQTCCLRGGSGVVVVAVSWACKGRKGRRGGWVKSESLR